MTRGADGSAAPASTLDRTLVGGDPTRAGTHGPYRRLRVAPGEPHRIRADLCSAAPLSPRRRIATTIAHLTDLHIVDPGSPARPDFAMRVGAGLPGWGGAVDWVFRPQELLTPHAVAAMVRTLAAFPIDLCIVTGDNIDNSQANELGTYLALLDGGSVAHVPGTGYHGPQRLDWDDDWYWRPDARDDRYQRRWGFPRVPGLLDAASQTFDTTGLGHPWLACLGNHDLLVGGTTAAKANLLSLVTGSRKPVRLPVGPAFEDALHVLLTGPEALFTGPSRVVPAVPERAFVNRDEIVKAHLSPNALPAGHGFTDRNLRDEIAYYAYDVTHEVRVIVLDTNHPYGHWDGSLDQRQLDWLAEQLDAVRGSGRLVVLASHHSTASMTNGFGVCPEDFGQRAFAAALLRVALHCPNAVLWLNGHHHTNRVVAHHAPNGGGLYEVTTAAITDWPSQARLIEIAVEPSGVICLTSTMIDHNSPATPEDDEGSLPWFAALHRELALNDAARAGRRGAEGSTADRNVNMLLPPIGSTL